MISNREKRRQRQQRRYRQWFHRYEVEYFIREHYPGCPEFAVRYFATSICTEPKNWTDFTVDMAVDHVIQCELRHRMTEYDQLMMVGVRRQEARRRVQPKIDAMIYRWKFRPAK